MGGGGHIDLPPPVQIGLSHFRQEHVPFFDKTTCYQLKNAAKAVLAREKSTSLAELFSVESKFAIDILNNCFSKTREPKFLKLDDIKKQMFIKKNPVVSSKKICSISVFLLDVYERGEVEHKSWYIFLLNVNIFFEKYLQQC